MNMGLFEVYLTFQSNKSWESLKKMEWEEEWDIPWSRRTAFHHSPLLLRLLSVELLAWSGEVAKLSKEGQYHRNPRNVIQTPDPRPESPNLSLKLHALLNPLEFCDCLKRAGDM